MSSDGTRGPVAVRGIKPNDPSKQCSTSINFSSCSALLMTESHRQATVSNWAARLEEEQSRPMELVSLGHGEIHGHKTDEGGFPLILFPNCWSVIPNSNLSYVLNWAGIHGRPYNNWPDQEWNKDEEIVNDQKGYCTHSSILFLTWHRPYLSLFEVRLLKLRSLKRQRIILILLIF